MKSFYLLIIAISLFHYSQTQVLDTLKDAKERETRGISYEGFKGKPASVEVDSEEAKEVAEVTWEAMKQVMQDPEYFVYVEAHQDEFLNYYFPNGKPISMKQKDVRGRDVLEPVTYARNSYLHLRLTPRDPSKKTEIHDATSVTDIDGYLNLHRHTFYEVVPDTDVLVPFSGSAKDFSVLYFNNVPQSDLMSEGKTVKLNELDIVILQGVSYEKKTIEAEPVDGMKTLVKQFPNYQFVYLPYMTRLFELNEKSVGLHHSEGTAVFSKYPILESSYIRLTRNFNDAADNLQRVCVRLLIDTPVGSLNVFIAQLSFASPKSRARTIEEVIVYTGSFNATIPQLLILENGDELEHKQVLAKGFKAKSSKNSSDNQTKQTVYFNGDAQLLSLHGVAPSDSKSSGNGLRLSLTLRNNPRAKTVDNLYAKKKLSLLASKKDEL